MAYAAFDLAGKVAVVTGAGRGLGRGMAVGLAEAGASVVVAGRTQAGLDETAGMIRSRGGEAHTVLIDATKREDCRRLVSEAVARYDKLDAMVVSHGVARHEPALEVTDAAWQETMAANLTGAFLCAQAAGLQMVKQGSGGSIILISSTASLVGFSKLAAYGASKGGVDQLCRQLAVEWGPYNIRVNAVNPGYTLSNMAGTEARHADAALNEEVRRMTPLQRRGTVEEIAGPVVFLASDAASFISGVCLAVDGGYCAM